MFHCTVQTERVTGFNLTEFMFLLHGKDIKQVLHIKLKRILKAIWISLPRFVFVVCCKLLMLQTSNNLLLVIVCKETVIQIFIYAFLFLPLTTDFFQLQETKKTRVVVDGEPGAGKTTFVKKLCQTWTPQGLCPCVTHQGFFQIVNFRIMLAIILRLVEPGFTLFDIILNQMPFLTVSEVCAVLDVIYSDPRNICIVLDGYDELRASDSDEIVKVIKGEIASDAICITTTRPHGVGRIKRYSAKSVQEHVRLCGFSPRQIEKYIEIFFDQGFTLSCKMTQEINSQPEFMELARIPIRLEMMCHVFGVKLSLGTNLVQLYDKFIECLLHHFERKKYFELTPENQILKKYHSLLMSVAEFANCWDRFGQMRIVFDFDDLKKAFRDPEHIINFGWITKYHPSSTLENSRWSFTHLSLHDYFVAFHLANTESPNTTDFSRRCHTVRTLEKHINIVKFLCTMNPSKANDVISYAMKRVKSPNECKRLLDLTLQFFPEYENVHGIRIPLPREVFLGTPKDILTKIREPDEATMWVLNLTKQFLLENGLKDEALDSLLACDKEEKSDQEILERKNMYHNMRVMLETDERLDMRNMKALHAYDMSLLPCVPNLDYVKDVEIVIADETDYSKAAEMLPGMSGMESLKVILTSEVTGELYHIIPKNLSSLTLLATNVTPYVKNIVKGMKKLKLLKLINLGRPSSQVEVTQMCEAVQECESITDLHIVSVHSEPALVFVTARRDCRVSLFMPYDEEDNSFMYILSRLEQRPPLFAICLTKQSDLLGNSLFGQLLVLLVHLKILSLTNCGITSQILGEMATNIEKSGKPHLIQKLEISGDTMEGCSDAMSRLLKWCPELTSLKAMIRGDDLCLIRKKLEKKLKIQQLHLDALKISKECKDLYMIFEYLPEIQELQLTGWDSSNNNNHLQYLLRSCKNSGLHQLQRLFIIECDLSTGGLRYLTKVIPNLQELQELHLPFCDCTDLDEISALVNNMPSSVKHLCLIGNNIVDLPFMLNKSKDKLMNLKRLNIGKDGTDDNVTIIEEALGNVEVYYDESEVVPKLSSVRSSTYVGASGILDWVKEISQTTTTYNLGLLDDV